MLQEEFDFNKLNDEPLRKNSNGVLSIPNGCAYVVITDDSNTHETTVDAHGFNVSCNALLNGTQNSLAFSREVERVITYTFPNP